MSIKQAVVIMTGALALASVGLVSAQSPAPADVIKARQQGFKDLGAAFKVIRDQAQSGTPDFEKIKTSAAGLKKAADGIGTWFPKGSGTEAGVKTAAKPEIWTDAAGFDAAVKAFVEQANKFQQVANGGDVAALQAAVKPVGQTCGGCHDKFRVKEN